MKIKIKSELIFVLLFLLVSFNIALSQNSSTIRATVNFFLPNGQTQPLPGATVTLLDKSKKVLQEKVTDDNGQVVFEGLLTGEYIVQGQMEGFKTIRQKVTISGKTLVNVKIDLPIQEVSTTVNVVAENKEEKAKQPTLPSVLKQQLLKSAPLVNERFQDALPLVPGVVRGPDGLLHLNGARASQSGLLVNSVNVTDPVTGQYAMELPIEAIESVKVYSNPYSAEFGKFTGAVTSIETRQGTNKWKFLITNFFPRLRKRNGTIMGIESVTPRMAITGPIVKNKLWFSQNFEYRYIRTRVPSLPDLHNDTVLETFDSFTRIDWNINTENQASAVFSLYPQNLQYVNMDTFHPEEVSPNFRQRGYFVAFDERMLINLNALLETTFSIKDLDAHIWGNSTSTMTISPDGWRGGFFDKQDRYGRRYEFSQTYTFNQHSWHGLHDPKMGYTISRSSFDAFDNNREVLILRADGTLAQKIDFVGSPYLNQGVTEVTAYIQDHWQVGTPLTIDMGLRFDNDSLASEYNFAPRFGFSLLPIPSSTRTVLRGGFGIFYDKIPLNAGVFPQYQRLQLTQFDQSGTSPIAQPVTYRNVIKDNNLENPYSLTWNLELDREIVKNLLFRVGYKQRRERDDLVLNTSNNSDPALVLSNDGSSSYKEWLFMIKYRFKENNQLTLSYVHSSSEGDLNQYEYYLGNYHYPIFRANEYGPQKYDVPKRFLLTGLINLPYGLIFAPVAEYRDGFPYSIIDENQNFVSPRNRGGRFPRFFSFDLQIMKKVPIKFFGKVYHTRIGIKIFNLTNHWNPRDIQNNIDSSNFQTFYNSVERTFRGKFEINF